MPMSRRRTHVARALAAALLAMAVSGCATSGNFRKGEELAREGDWDTAVAYYTKALQDDPDRPDYKISLERAMLKAAQVHMAAAREFDRKGDVENALVEYRKVLEFEPGASHAITRRGELERQAREKSDATRTPPRIDTMRERARRATEGPILNPTSKAPLSLNFATNTAIQDILRFIGDVTGINVIIEQGAQSVVTRGTTLNVSGVTLEQGLNLVMTANQLWYKVLNDRTILVIQDTAQKRQQYEEQIIRTFYVSHADPQEIYQMINQIVRIQGIAITPVVSINKTANTITVRGTPNLVNILEKVIQANDRPRAEIIIDVELLEVNRTRVKEFGLNLAQYQIGAIFSPEGPPAGNQPGPGDGDGSAAVIGGSTFNLNTISQGISTADFYLTVPQAVVKFLASDGRTRVLAKPQLRGAEGTDLELNIGDEVPVPSTVFGGLGAGGVNTVPISSFTYRNVGVNVQMRPRVTFENEIILDMTVENSTLGGNINVAGQSLPTFGTRKVKTRMRLREGESNLIAGLVREEDRKTLSGVVGLMRIPILKDILGGTEEQITSTDIVMLLTPRIVRTHELTQEHLNPIYIGSQMNLGLSGPAPAIGAEPLPAVPEPAAAAPPGAVPPGMLPGNTSPTSGAVTSTPGIAPPAPTTPPSPQPNPPASPPPSFNPPTPGSTTPPVPPTSPTPPSMPPDTSPATPPASPPPPAGESTAPASAASAPPAATPQVSITTPGPEFRVGGGPYTVPIAISNASRLSLMSVSLTYNPAIVRVRSVQEGPFFRQGGATASFNQQVDANAGRVDISVTRGADPTGASGTGLLAALVFDAVAPGTATFTLTGVSAQPDGRSVPVTFIPATVTVR
jgi:type II secretory pathway component GspD/PulD (secretin)